MKHRSAKIGLILFFMVLLFFRIPGAEARPPGLDVFLLTSQMQAQVLQGIIKVYGDTLLKFEDAEKGFESRMKNFDALAEKLAAGLRADLPGNENLSKYFTKLTARKRLVKKAGGRLLEQRRSGRKIQRADIEPLEKAAFQTVYAARQLMRNIVRKMDLAKADQEESKRIAEVLLLAEMQGHLLNSIKDAFADNINCNSAPADTFWLDLASFDILVTVYRAGTGLFPSEPANAAKTKALAELMALKHDVLMEGEAMYLVAKTCTPDLDAARAVEGAAARIGALFKVLIGETLK